MVARPSNKRPGSRGVAGTDLGSGEAKHLERSLLASPMLRRIGRALAGCDVHLTGGALRDRGLGRPGRDLDLVTSADPEEVASVLARHLGGRPFPLGKPPLVSWRLVAGSWQVDVAPRQGTLEEDVLRRDFTVNALLWRLPGGPLTDLVGGAADLAGATLRVVRAANLDDDPLRVLRGLRLISTHGLRPAAGTAEALGAAAAGLAQVARERVVYELSLLLAAPHVQAALATGAATGVLAAVLPAWKALERTRATAGVAPGLAALARTPGRLGSGARAALPALLAAPAAGFPDRFDETAAARELACAGWPPRAARDAARGAAAGEALLGLPGLEGAGARVAAVQAGELLPVALAWLVARRPEAEPVARRLLAWQRGFARRPPLVGGEELARILDLPPGPARACAAAELRAARAAGRVVSRRQALAWLAARANGG